MNMHAQKRFRTRTAVDALKISLIIWLSSLLLALLVVYVLVLQGKHIIYPASAFGQFSGDVLAFIGVILAVLLAVFTWMTSQNSQSRDTGFQTLRQATANLENLNIQLKQKCLAFANELSVQGRAIEGNESCTKLVMLNAWIQDIDCLTKRLNLITMNWMGWQSDPALQDELVDHVYCAQALSENVEDEVQATLTRYKQYMRNVLFGLYRLDGAIVGDILLHRLATIFGSLAVLIAFGFGFRIAANLDIGFSYTFNVIFFDAAFLGICAFIHLSTLVFFVFRWWDETRKREIEWKS